MSLTLYAFRGFVHPATCVAFGRTRSLLALITVLLVLSFRRLEVVQ
jgi:hypothetical protein